MRLMTLGALLAFSLTVGGYADAAGSKCDSGVTKAAGKKVYCKAKENSKAQKNGTTPDATKLTKCEDKFTKSCTKAKEAGDCVAQPQTCAQTEIEADACVVTISGPSSPSAAFID